MTTDETNINKEYKPKHTFVKCPNCQGWGSFSYGKVKCISCDGKGVIEVPVEEVES